MKLYFIRHGENKANIDHTLAYKVVDYALNETGVQQAQYLAAWLADQQIVRVYASPLKRATQTAQIVADRLGLAPITFLADLCELNVGVLDGHSDLRSWEIHDDIVHRWFEGNAELSFEGGENLLQLQARLRRAVEQILAANVTLTTAQSVAIVAHGGVITFGLPALCPTLTQETYRVGMQNTATTIVEVNEVQLSCLQWGLTAHLPLET